MRKFYRKASTICLSRQGPQSLPRHYHLLSRLRRIAGVLSFHLNKHHSSILNNKNFMCQNGSVSFSPHHHEYKSSGQYWSIGCPKTLVKSTTSFIHFGEYSRALTNIADSTNNHTQGASSFAIFRMFVTLGHTSRLCQVVIPQRYRQSWQVYITITALK